MVYFKKTNEKTFAIFLFEGLSGTENDYLYTLAIGNQNKFGCVASNLTNDIYTITTKFASSNCIATLHDVMGKELKTQNLNASKSQMSLHDLRTGNFLLKVLDGGRLVGVMRMVKMGE